MDVILGSIMLFPYNFTPNGWLSCDGQTLNTNQYSTIFSLIGTTYGGNGYSTFMLPNLNGVNGGEPLSPMRYFIAMSGSYPSRP